MPRMNFQFLFLFSENFLVCIIRIFSYAVSYGLKAVVIILIFVVPLWEVGVGRRMGKCLPQVIDNWKFQCGNA